MSAETILYFAYGSNMQRATFEGRRGMVPLRHEVGCLDGFQLRFDLAVGPGERGVANLAREDGSEVYGVMYEITTADAERLDKTEGVDSGLYSRVDLGIMVDGERDLECFTYLSENRDKTRKPSERYLGIVVEGALEHGLPAAYITWLCGHELAVDERLENAS